MAVKVLVALGADAHGHERAGRVTGAQVFLVAAQHELHGGARFLARRQAHANALPVAEG
jgi:hypothetical protein